MRVAASLYTMFNDVSLIERYERAAKLGFKLVECPFPYTVDAHVLKKEADKWGLQHVFINAPPGFMSCLHGIEVNIEPINNYSIPQYWMNSLDLAVRTVEEVNMPNLKIDYDVFHLQLICGQLSAILEKHKDKIGHVQVAQAPNRDEPDADGEIDYGYIFDLVKKANPEWIIGGEYVDRAGNETNEWVKKYGLEF